MDSDKTDDLLKTVIIPILLAYVYLFIIQYYQHVENAKVGNSLSDKVVPIVSYMIIPVFLLMFLMRTYDIGPRNRDNYVTMLYVLVAILVLDMFFRYDGYSVYNSMVFAIIVLIFVLVNYNRENVLRDACVLYILGIMTIKIYTAFFGFRINPVTRTRKNNIL